MTSKSETQGHNPRTRSSGHRPDTGAKHKERATDRRKMHRFRTKLRASCAARRERIDDAWNHCNPRSAARAAARRRSRSGSSRRTSMSSKSWRQSKRRDVRRRRGEVGGGGGCMGQGAQRHRFTLGSVDEQVDDGSPGKMEPVASHEEGSNSGWEQGCAWVQTKQACSALLRRRTKLYLICNLPLSAGHRRIDKECCRSVSADLPGTPANAGILCDRQRRQVLARDKLKSGH